MDEQTKAQLHAEVDALCKKYNVVLLDYIGNGWYVTDYISEQYVQEFANENGYELTPEFDFQKLLGIYVDMGHEIIEDAMIAYYESGEVGIIGDFGEYDIAHWHNEDEEDV